MYLNTFLFKKKKLKIFWGLYFSVLSFFILEILNAWVNPEWFRIFPVTSAYNLMNALRVYTLCCFFYFAGYYILSLEFFIKTYNWLLFAYSFLPVVIFSIMVLLQLPLEIIDKLVFFIAFLNCIVILIIIFIQNKISKSSDFLKKSGF